jgi:hypothetical protein
LAAIFPDSKDFPAQTVNPNNLPSSINSETSDEFTQTDTLLLACISWIVRCYPGMHDGEFKSCLVFLPRRR